MYIKEGANIQRLISGGRQERAQRGGTVNVAAAAGLAAALETRPAYLFNGLYYARLVIRVHYRTKNGIGADSPFNRLRSDNPVAVRSAPWPCCTSDCYMPEEL